MVSSCRARLLATTALALAALSIGSGAHAAGSGSGYEDLGSLGGNYAQALGISADGSIMVGYVNGGGMFGGGHAFSWTASGGDVDLGMLGTGDSSMAYAVSGDGSVIVGSSNSSPMGTTHAFSWTASGGMVDLGTFGGNSAAYAANTDGSVIVGFANNGTNDRAFRWTDAGGMVDLGTLGGTTSYARGVSGDGTVVVGDAYIPQPGPSHAFRWTDAGGMEDLGVLGTGAYSRANAVSTDGTTIIGYSEIDSSSARHAFRWTQSGNMQDLGSFSGSSEAYAVNADGSVVVGQSGTANGNRAFRWTDATGMVTVEDWLRANGVTVATDFTRDAKGVSADGTIIVGNTASSTPYIARLSSTGNSGIIDVVQYYQTVAAKPTAQIGLDYAGTAMNGAHGEPMRNLLAPGRQSFGWTADIGYENNDQSEGGVGIGDLNYGIGLEGSITARLALGGLYTRQDLASGGNFHQSGFYVAPEVSLPVAGNVYATVGGYFAPGKLDINRGYENGGLNDTSRGKTDIDTWAAKLRFDWLNAASIEDTKLTPYASLTYAHSHMDGYTENGGSFPAVFDATNDHSTVVRVGLDSVTAITDGLRLTGKAEAAYRFEKQTADISGSIIGLSDFKLSGRDIDQFWVRGAIGAEFDVAGGTASLSLNASTEGDDPTIWLKSGWKVTF